MQEPGPNDVPIDLEQAQRPPIHAQTDHEQAGKSPWNTQNLLNGFPRFSRVLAADPSQSMIVFKRFDETCVRNLLLLEARVAALDRLKKFFDEEDRASVIQTIDTGSPAGVNDIQKISQSWEEFALLGTFFQRNPGAASRLHIRDQHLLEGGQRKRELPWFAIRKWASERRKTIKATRGEPFTEPDEMDDWSENLASRNPESFLGSVSDELPKIQERWELANATESAIKDYQEALLRHHQILQIKQPASRTLWAVRTWFNGGPQFRSRTSAAQFVDTSGMAHIFEDPEGAEEIPKEARLAKPDFVALARAGGDDPISRFGSRFVASNIGPFSSWLRNKYYSSEAIDYISEGAINNLAISIRLFIALMFLVGAVWTLWGADHDAHPAVALGVLSAWVLLFGFVINYGTNATSDQVLGATAAYAAVLVVFIGPVAFTAN